MVKILQNDLQSDTDDTTLFSLKITLFWQTERPNLNNKQKTPPNTNILFFNNQGKTKNITSCKTNKDTNKKANKQKIKPKVEANTSLPFASLPDLGRGSVALGRSLGA